MAEDESSVTAGDEQSADSAESDHRIFVNVSHLNPGAILRGKTYLETGEALHDAYHVFTESDILSLKESKDEFEEEARYLLALKFYELGKISSGKAAKLAGMGRVEFLLRLGRYKVTPFQMDMDEILGESKGE